MAQKHLTVLALIRAKNGREDSLESELKALLVPTRQEEGCIHYEMHRSIQDLLQFMFYETWLNKEALDRHLASAHIQNFITKATDLLAEPIAITLWEVSG